MPEEEEASGGRSTSTSREIAGLRRELKLTWDAHKREHTLHDDSHSREHQFTADALKVAAELAKENKADANEWRDSMNDREVKFATKTDIGNLSDKIEALTKADGQFATRADMKSLGDKIDKLEESEIRRAENERLRLVQEAKDKDEAQRRQTRSQWTVGLIVGLLSTFGAILVSLVIRLLTT